MQTGKWCYFDRRKYKGRYSYYLAPFSTYNEVVIGYLKNGGGPILNIPRQVHEINRECVSYMPVLKNMKLTSARATEICHEMIRGLEGDK